MTNISFGSYLKSLRISRNPKMTQEDLAGAVGRSKMTISLIEQGKNSPPEGQLLDDIITTLALDEKEKDTAYFLAARARNNIPGNIEEYFFKNPSIYVAIRTAQRVNANNNDWDRLVSEMRDSHEENT